MKNELRKMEPLEQYIELIENYVEGKMNSVERRDFEAKINKSAELKREVADFRMMRETITRQSRLELKEEFRLLDREQNGEKKRPVISWRLFSSIAASLIILITAGSLFFYAQRPAEKIFDQFYATYPNVVSSIQRGDGKSDLRSQAFALYEDKMYKQSLKKFQRLIDQGVQEPEVSLYFGLTLLELDHSKDALRNFDAVISDQPNKYEEQALWYAALASLKLNKIDQSKKYAKQLLDKRGFYSAKARELLTALEDL